MIECTKFKSLAKPGSSLQGFADLYIDKWQLEIFGCTLHMKDGKRWLNLPNKEYLDDQGVKKYAPIIKFKTKDLQDTFSEKAKEAIDKKCGQSNLFQ